MALLGGGVGGAGNPVGGSFTGPAEALEIVGTRDTTFCYAYSGGIPAAAVTQTWLSFTTGNYVAAVTFQVNTPVKADTPLDVSGLVAVIKMNGNVICNLVCDPQSAPNAILPTSVTQDLIIPSYTEVAVEVTTDAEDLDDIGSAVMTGRIYRTRD